jgi:DNA-binding HxlR family transcriptional regulator
MERSGHPSETVCQRFHWAIEIIGRRWTGAVLWALFMRPLRFGEIRERIPEISDRMLTERLRELEQLGIVTREAEGAGHACYRLTPQGEALRPVMTQIQLWAEAWHPESTQEGKQK